jgi:hypothetical protein
MKISPSETAGGLRVVSPNELLARTSNLGVSSEHKRVAALINQGEFPFEATIDDQEEFCGLDSWAVFWPRKRLAIPASMQVRIGGWRQASIFGGIPRGISGAVSRPPAAVI